MSLRTRLALIAAATGTALVLVVAVVSWWLANSSLRSTSDEGLSQRASELAERFADLPDLSLISQAAIPAIQPAGPRVQVLDADAGLLLDGGVPVRDEDRTAASVFSASPRLRDEAIEDTKLRVATASVEGGGAVMVALDRAALEAGLDEFLARLMIAGAMGIIGAAVVGWLIARSVARPVVAVSGAAEQLADLDDLPARIDVTRNDELGRLGVSFNRVLDALEVSRDQQDRLVGDASHELRTPLTSLRMKVELLQQAPDLPTDQRQRFLDEAAAELASLSDLVAELVELASSTETNEDPSEPVVLRELVAGVVAEAKRRTSRAITLTGDDAVVHVNARLVRRAVSNLVSNALKFSPSATQVEIDVRHGHVSVRDHGPGIRTSDRARVFDRFYRGPDTQTTAGHGIGLAIVASVAERHNGTVTITEAHDGGAIVSLDLDPTAR